MALLASCDDSTEFTITGTIEGAGMQTVRIFYYSRGAVQENAVQAENGKFVITGESPDPTLVTLSMAGSGTLATFVASNGDEIKCKIDLNNPLSAEVKGNRTSKALAEFNRENAELISSGDYRELNNVIANYIRSHPSDMASTVLLTTRFYTPGYELMADSLLTSIEPSARPTAVIQNFSSMLSAQLTKEVRGEVPSMSLYSGTDSIKTYGPNRQAYSLLGFVGDNRMSRDSIIPRLRALHAAYPIRRLRVMEISMALDSATWKSSIAADSARWLQAWAPGTVAGSAIRRLAVPRIPFFVVCDSTGTQLYRGSSITEAEALIRGKLH